MDDVARPGTVIDSQTGEEHGCLDGPEGCGGEVAFRMPLSGTGRAFARCDTHWEKRLDWQEEHNRKYPTLQPSNFDPSYAGERWYEDY